ncbi:helix-turn-helix domain-containing protein [Paenibacillus oryzisoli]|uniref:AraC family transcriptional regulator n=1 Tax=Paenibacillus oryzisoli TaxID=1850517 RepID=UPI003D2976B9
MEQSYRFPNIVQTLQVIGCHFGVQPPGWTYPLHHHHLFELLYCLEGEVVQDVQRSTITLRAGDWLLIKSGVRHRTANPFVGAYRYFNVHFDLDDPEVRSLLAAEPYRLITAEEAASRNLRHYVGELEQVSERNPELGGAGAGAAMEYSTNGDGRKYERRVDAGRAEDRGREQPQHAPVSLRFEDKLLVQSYTLLIIHDVLAYVREHPGASGPGGRRRHKAASEAVAPAGDASLFATEVAHLIEEKLALGLSGDGEATIAGIAKELNMSRSQCSKLFSRVYGLSPRQYMSQQKLKLAKELLVTTHLPVADIAERLGFQSASHFSRQFRRWTGQSPSEFKPKHRGEGRE